MSYQLRYGKDLIKFLEKHRNLAPTILEKLELLPKVYLTIMMRQIAEGVFINENFYDEKIHS